MPWQSRRLTVPEIEALAEAEAQRWNRSARLAAWQMEMLPAFLATGVAWGIAMCFGKDTTPPTLPDWDELLKTMPDFWRPDGER